MSYDYWGTGFTDLEMAAGIPDLVYGQDNEAGYFYEDKNTMLPPQRDHQDILKLYLDEDNEIVSSFSLLKLKSQFLNKILNCQSSSAIERHLKDEVKKLYIDRLALVYFKEEKLDSSLIKLAKSENCLEEILTNVLFRHSEIPFRGELQNSIKKEVEKIQSSKLSAYYKTGMIQAFIHNTINDYYNTNSAHLLLSADVMRTALSITRLNIFIYSILTKSQSDLDKEIAQAREEAEREKQENTDTRISNKKKYILNWKVRHLKPLNVMLDYDYKPKEIHEVFSCLLEQIIEKIDLSKDEIKTVENKNDFGVNIDIGKLAKVNPLVLNKLLNVVANYYIDIFKRITSKEVELQNNAFLVGEKDLI
ncbi:hypothetical protein [Pseudoalteromonas sp. 1CM17D]|uniref:hypothetical protein n=1 Tax=Pseudoalteromonas sp. 1CM17D TaxID=2929162 RepID=UPI0020BE7E63|nr:hypothetical protein [Pseudoalteromonas sp. 1CM17D]MCK8095039.1 hypothetical protein [Pseudoalteromonas sp. 1CM17D]